MRLLGKGQRSKEIARELVLSTRTIEWHVHNLHRKLGTKRRCELVAIARRLGVPVP